jgi:hypothetical protein
MGTTKSSATLWQEAPYSMRLSRERRSPFSSSLKYGSQVTASGRLMQLKVDIDKGLRLDGFAAPSGRTIAPLADCRPRSLH